MTLTATLLNSVSERSH